MYMSLKKLLKKMLNAKPQFTDRTFSISPKSSGYYEYVSVNIALSGYTPIYVGFGSNQVALHLYHLHFDNTYAYIGRVLGTSGNTLSANTVTVYVRYMKNSVF